MAAAIAALAIGSIAETGAGQPAVSPPGMDSCRVSPTADSVLVHVWAKVVPTDTMFGFPDWYADAVLQEVANRFVVPSPLVVGTYEGQNALLAAPPLYNDAGIVFSSLHLALGVRLRKAGARPDHLRFIASSTNAPFDDAVATALLKAIADGAIPPLPDRGEAEAELIVRTSLDLPVDGLRLFAMRSPMLRYSSGPRIRAATVPEYPPGLATTGVAGSAELQFVIDAAGQLDRTSLQLHGMTDVQFAAALLRVLPSYRFEGAEVNGCPVASVVRFPVRFSILP